MSFLRVMTFNLRGAVLPDGENVWPNRARFAVETIRKYDPDLIGFQEVQEGNLDTFRKLLTGYARETGPRYNNREPHAYPSIFWKPERLEKLEAGEFWLSSTPDRFSGDWDTDCIRSALWLKFRTVPDGGVFIHLNTHLDHVSAEARFGGSKVIVERLRSAGPDIPIVVTGDFNCDPGSDPYRAFEDEGFSDTFLTAGNMDGDDVYTFHGFTGRRTEQGGRIDWILVREGSATVQARHCRICRDERPPLYPSDHYPVQAEIEINTTNPR